MTHSTISPAILYFGTPVALITSQNEDETSNISTISSIFWLAHRCVLGFAAESKTPQSILRTRQCVVNLPDESLVSAVNALATTTGTEFPSASKIARGYRFEPNKWSAAGLTPLDAQLVRPARIKECHVQMECELIAAHPMMGDWEDRRGALVTMEMKVVRVHILDSLRMDGFENRVDPLKWRPLIMSFQQFFGLRDGIVARSELAKVDEEEYRGLTRTEAQEDATCP